MDVLFGDGAQADAFHDPQLGVAVDHLDEARTDHLRHDLALRYLEEHPGELSAHHDA